MSKNCPIDKEVDTERVKSWAYCISDGEEIPARQLQKKHSPESFKKDQFGIESNSGKWRKYLHEMHVPSIAFQKKMGNKASCVLNHRIWDLFRKTPPSHDRLKTLIAPAKPALTKVVGAYPAPEGEWMLVNERTYNYFFKRDFKKILSNHSQRDSVDKFIGALVLLIDAENRGSKLQYKMAYSAAQFNLRTACGYLQYIKEEQIRKLFDLRFKPSPHLRHRS